MASARTVTCGDYLAIGDIGSNQIRIFNQDGQVGSVTTSYPIVDVAVASQGVVAAVMSEGTSNYIYLYSSSGEELVAIKTNVSQMGYPLDFALSEDGEKLVVSYLNINEGLTATNLVFYSFGEAGANEVDHIMGSYANDSIIPKVEFLNNNTIAAYAEESFALYSMNYYPELIRETDFGREIKSLFASDKYLVLYSEIIQKQMRPGKKALTENIIWRFIRLPAGCTWSGILTLSTRRSPTRIRRSSCTMDSECVIYTFSGKEKFRYTFNEPIIKLLPKNTMDEYILITSSAIQEIRLK